MLLTKQTHRLRKELKIPTARGGGREGGILRLSFSPLVVSDSLLSLGLQHARLPCPSPPSGACSSSSPLSQWCHPPISSSAALFSSCPQSFPASESFPVSLLFTSDGQGTGASASASVLPMTIQSWFPLGLTDLTLLSKRHSRVFSNTTVQMQQFFGSQFPYDPNLTSGHHCCI